jgi:hypothetical protein
MIVIRKVKSMVNDQKTIIFNAGDMSIKMMYYTDLTAYPFVPSQPDCDSLTKAGYKIAILKNDTLPAYIENSTSILKISR